MNSAPIPFATGKLALLGELRGLNTEGQEEMAMGDFLCEIERKRFEKGPCLYEKRGTTEGNRTCPECSYFKTHLPAKTEPTGPVNKSPEKNCKKVPLQLKKRLAVLEAVYGVQGEIKIDGKLYVAKLQQKNRLDGKSEVKHLYGFTEETRNDFKDPLKEYDGTKVETFINRIESDIGNFISVKRDLGGQPGFHVREIEDTINALERASMSLLKICSGRLKVLYQAKHSYAYKFENPDDPLSGDLYEEVKASCNFKSEVVLRSLSGLLRDLRLSVSIETKKRGHPNADADDLAFQIASSFQELIAPPRPWSGHFPFVVSQCFNIAGIKGKDRNKAVHQALLKLSRA